MGSCSSSHAWLLEGILFSLWSAILNGLSTDFHPKKKGMVITENERQSKLVCWKIPHWVWWCSQLPPFSVVSHGSFWPNGPSRSSMWAFGRASNCAKRFLRCHVSWWCPICIKRTSQRRRNRSESCWKDATVDSRFTSILIMVTFFWLHFCTWPRRSLHRAPFVWELQWPHFEIPTPQYPVQNEVQREKMWRGAGLEWLMLLKNSQQRVIARHGTEKFPLRFPIDYKHFIRI